MHTALLFAKAPITELASIVSVPDLGLADYSILTDSGAITVIGYTHDDLQAAKDRLSRLRQLAINCGLEYSVDLQ